MGIDLASQPDTTGVCLLAWHPRHTAVVLLARGTDRGEVLDDQRVLALMLGRAGLPGPAKIGIDAPLGWPAAFVAAVGDPDAWPLEPAAQRSLTKRRTDLHVQASTGKVPLSVSADRIAYPAMRAQRLLRRHREATGAPVDRSGLTGAICEVYPDPAVTSFGLRPAGPKVSYKGAAGSALRTQLIARLLEQAPWLVLSAEQRADCVAFDDFLDALIAALITRAVQLGLTEPPPEAMVAEARAEGWIHLPRPNALAQLDPRPG